MQTKLFEIRDRATFIPIVAVECSEGYEPSERYLLRRAGYACDGETIVLLTPLAGGKSSYDVYEWGGRTFPVAHHYIVQHWDELKTGDVVDVEFILGETKEKKISEQYEGV